MGWRDLVEDTPSRLAIPWLGGRKVHRGGRTYRIETDIPKEFGWYLFGVTGRSAVLLEKAEADQDCCEGWPKKSGYLVGDRLVRPLGTAAVGTERFFDCTDSVHLVEPGLDRFSFVGVAKDPDGNYVYLEELFPLGPEDAVRRAFVERRPSIYHIPHVTPALDLAFLFATEQRTRLEIRRAELRAAREEQRRREEAMKNMGTGLGRRTLAAVDFEAAARAALAVGGAELLDARPGRTRNEMIVQYRFEHRMLECVARKDTLQIVDSGICLEDHRTHEKGDTYFTLESLPAVVGQAIRERKLVVYRHVDGDVADDYDDDWED
jgi:hypothetical protein